MTAPLRNLPDNENDGSSNAGYIHNSRVVKLTSMHGVPQTFVSDKKAVFSNDTIIVTITTAAFVPSKHVLTDSESARITDWSKEIVYLQKIDNGTVWGEDGNMPDTEVRLVTVRVQGKEFILPPGAIKNLYAPCLARDYTSVHIGPDGEIYIWMTGGDGAASYNAIWVVLDGEVKCMYVGLGWFV